MLFFLAGTFAFAQKGHGDNPQIQEMRMEFFNKELQLTATESETFWPTYDQFKADQRALKKEYRADRKMELMTDEEAERYVEDHLILEEKQIALKRQYINKFKKVISIRKIAMIHRTERKFKQELLGKIKDRRRSEGARR